MPVIQGNISGSIKSVALNLPCTIKWFSVYDKSGSGATVKIAIVTNTTEIYIKNIVLAANASFDGSVDVKILASSQILIVANASTDYYFSLE